MHLYGARGATAASGQHCSDRAVCIGRFEMFCQAAAVGNTRVFSWDGDVVGAISSVVEAEESREGGLGVSPGLSRVWGTSRVEVRCRYMW